jgi:lipoprotein NlpI
MKKLLQPVSRFRLALLWLCLYTFFAVLDSNGQSAATDDKATAQTAQLKARELLEAAGDAHNKGAADTVEAKCQAVIELLPEDPRVRQRAAEMLFLVGRVEASLPHFDKAIELSPKLAPMNWQRGIALATAGKFKEGAAQFKLHHDVNPNDVENSAWYFLCLAKSTGLDAAKRTVIPSRGDSRPPMMTILQMLRGDATTEQVLEAGEASRSEPGKGNLGPFYANLYVGLYYDAIGRKEDAAKYLARSLEYENRDYMHHSARWYLKYQVHSTDLNDTNANR